MNDGWLWLSILNTTAWPSPMSITPAFSPGPWITQGALVGSPLRCSRDDLYEQCSFHIAEKIPSSVKLGTRPMSFKMRSYSSGLRPWLATSSGVICGWFMRLLCSSRRAFQMRDEAGEQAAAVGAAHDVFDVVFRMRHHAEHVAGPVDDAGDRVRGAIDIGVLVDCAFGGAVAIEYASFAFEPLQRLFIGL